MLTRLGHQTQPDGFAQFDGKAAEGQPRAHSTSNSLGPAPRISATGALIGLNLAVFTLMVVTGTSLLSPTGGQIVNWGGNYAPLTMGKQWWRVFTSIFVHVGLFHLVVNMWCLYQLGGLAERLYGRWSFLLLYLLTGVAGSIASISRGTTVASAGSSGAIFGLAGALITSLFFGKLPIPRRDLIIALGSLLLFAGYNLAYGFLRGGIDNGAHVGGLICGLLMGAFFSRDLRSTPGSPPKSWVAFPATMLLLLCAFGLVWRIRGQALTLESARKALNQGDADLAIRKLSALTTGKRYNPEVYSILGMAYAQQGRYTESEANLRRVLETNPSDVTARSNLALVYLHMGRLEDSQKEFAGAVELNPKSDRGWMGLGLTLQRMGRHEDAVVAFNSVLRINPKLREAQFDLGISAMNLRRYDEAIAAFKKSAELNPRDYRAQIWLANAYDARGLTSEAATAYIKASALGSTIRSLGRTTSPNPLPAQAGRHYGFPIDLAH
jgi:membrane associated rhomboid family serine protease/Flp pilus assembly protein TadD